MSRIAVAFDKETGVALGLVRPSATGNRFAVSNGAMTTALRERMAREPCTMSCCRHTGIITVSSTHVAH